MPKKSPAPPEAPTDQAQQIWLAGLGAFSQAQKKGTEALQKMLQDGLQMQRQAQQTAEQKIADASEKMSAMAQQLAKGQVPKAMHTPTAPWDSLEGLFEQRVAQALERLGWVDPSRLTQLEQRLHALEQQLQHKTASKKTSSANAKPPRKARNG
jgi:poly(hydroxyalkanoate) granule-associated protein